MSDIISPQEAEWARSAELSRRRQAVYERALQEFTYNVKEWPERKSFKLKLCSGAFTFVMERVKRIVELGGSDLYYDLRAAGWDVEIGVERVLFGNWYLKVVIK